MTVLRSSVLLTLLVLETGCYTKYYPIAEGPFPEPLPATSSRVVVGITQNERSSFAPAEYAVTSRRQRSGGGLWPKSIATSTVVERLAKHIRDEKLFAWVIYPYAEMAVVQPAFLLDATVRIEEQRHTAENLGKTLLHGITLLLLLPVTPIRLTYVVDLSVSAYDAKRNQFGMYSYVSVSELKYTTLKPNQDTVDEWIKGTVDRAIVEVVNQLKQDLPSFASDPRPTLRESSPHGYKTFRERGPPGLP